MSRFKQIKQYPTDKGKTLTMLCDKAEFHDELSGTLLDLLAQAKERLETTDRLLKSKPLSKDILTYAARYFLTSPKRIEDNELKTIQLVVTMTKNGLVGQNLTIKIGDKVQRKGQGKDVYG